MELALREKIDKKRNPMNTIVTDDINMNTVI